MRVYSDGVMGFWLGRCLIQVHSLRGRDEL